MSIVSALENQNRLIRTTVTSTATLVGATSIAITINPWPSFSCVTRLIISSSNSVSNLTATLVSDGAAYRAGSNDGKYIMCQKTDALSTTWRLTDMGGAYVQDAYVTDCLHLVLSSGSAFTTGTVFTVTVEGRRQTPHSRDLQDGTPSKLDRSERVLLVPASGTATNLTPKVLRNGNPYGLGSYSESLRFVALNSTTDHLLIGSVNQFNKVFFGIPGAAALPASSVLTAEVWNGSAWVSNTFQNNTSDGQTTPSTFSYSGVLSLTTPAAWVPLRISVDPLSIDEDAINAASTVSVGALSNPNRYWLRLSVSPLGSVFSPCEIRILK